MAYTDPDAVRVVLTPDGDDTDAGSAAFLSDTDLTAAIADATDEVNARLGVRYTVPFADGSVPDLIGRITARIAAYLATLSARRGDPLDPQEPVALGYARAVAMLNQLQSGTATLGLSSPTDNESPDGGGVVANPLDGDLFGLGMFPDRARYGMGAGPYGYPAWV